MKLTLRIGLPLLTAAIVAAACLLPTPGEAGGPFRLFRKRQKTPVECLAEGIDDVEDELNEIGTVVAKRPDIWGESRLTKHRQEVEKQLAEKIDDFELLLNASVARSDQAFLASATAITSALGDLRLQEVNSQGQAIFQLGDNEDQRITVPPATNLLNTNLANAVPGSVVVADPNDLENTTNVPIVGSAPFGLQGVFTVNTDPDKLGFKDSGISLEPTIQLDQLNRYLQHLQELRRLNEGGDTADAPGYALNLVRIPVSVIPGDKSRKGHGASITITAKPHYNDSLLVTTFRTLVVNDLVDQLALPLTKAANAIHRNEQQSRKTLDVLKSAADRIVTVADRIERCADDTCRVAHVQALEDAITQLASAKHHADRLNILQSATADRVDTAITTSRDYVNNTFAFNGERGVWKIRELSDEERATVVEVVETAELIPTAAPDPALEVTRLRLRDDSPDAIVEATKVNGLSTDNEKKLNALRSKREPADARTKAKDAATALATVREAASALTTALPSVADAIQSAVIQAVPGSTPRARSARYAVPPSRITCTFGDCELQLLAQELAKFQTDGCKGEVIHLSDTRAFLREELQSAYDFLHSRAGVGLWDMDADIRDAIRHSVPLDNLRSQVTVCQGPTDCCSHVQRALTWAILVEAVLLNERLNVDLDKVAGDPNCACSFGENYRFHHPLPDEMTKQAFLDYVDCRWPVHVFALDPVAQQQNVADAFSMRREMQLALALAFVGGEISAQNMTRYMRRIELDMQTVALNQTAIAFGHGRDTFGWRFYPRIQTPDIEGNLTTLFRDLIGGGPSKDALMCDHRLEPGMRECTALVIMPSFINHMRFDIRSHYFELTDPDDVKGSMRKTIELSKKIRHMQRLAECAHLEADEYRFGEVERLTTRVDQLSKKMPLQTVHTQVPNENTLGGFEMFSSGVTDLSPELIDFYGQPGVNPAANTKLFIVGKNFSVHDTRVVAGNRKCDFELVSREIMEVTIPPGVQLVNCRKPVTDPCADESGPCTYAVERYVDLHVATPYGVTRHLKLPVIEDFDPGSLPGMRWQPGRITAEYYYAGLENDKDVDLTGPILGGIVGQGMRLEAPRGVTPPATVAMRFRISITANPAVGVSGLVVNNIDVTDVQFDPSANAYVFSTANLAVLHTGIRNRVQEAIKGAVTKPLTATFARTRSELANLRVTIDIEGTPHRQAGTDVHEALQIVPIQNRVQMTVERFRELP